MALKCVNWRSPGKVALELTRKVKFGGVRNNSNIT